MPQSAIVIYESKGDIFKQIYINDHRANYQDTAKSIKDLFQRNYRITSVTNSNPRQHDGAINITIALENP